MISPGAFSRWSSVFRVDVMEQMGGSYLLIHDGMAGSAAYRFDGDLSKLGRMSADIRSKPFSVLGKDPRVLIIGAAGGHEILASLYFGAGSITELSSSWTHMAYRARTSL